MRPGQKNRMRGGRGNNNGSRRGPNPLTRSYESNGPDVKVRGTPQHIAEKYVQLARDAHSSGDTVMVESYLQHAEHYYRIIVAAQNVQQQAYNQANGIATTEVELDDEDEFEVAGSDRFTFRTPQSFLPGAVPNGQNGGYGQPYQQGQGFGGDPSNADQPLLGDAQPPMAEGMQPQFQPQPRGDRPPFGSRRFEERGERQDGRQEGRQEGRPEGRGDRRFGRDRGNRSFGGDRTNPDGTPRADRPPGDRQPGDRQAGDRQAGDRQPGDRQPGDRPFAERNYGDRGERPPMAPRGETYAPAPAAVASGEEQTGLPSFITAPVRAIPIIDAGEPPEAAVAADAIDTGVRPRRRRRRVPGDVPGAPEAGAPEAGEE